MLGEFHNWIAPFFFLLVQYKHSNTVLLLHSGKSSYLMSQDLGGGSLFGAFGCMFKNSVSLAHHLFQYLETSISNIKKKTYLLKRGILVSCSQVSQLNGNHGNQLQLSTAVLLPRSFHVSGPHRSSERVFPCTRDTVLPARLTQHDGLEPCLFHCI